LEQFLNGEKITGEDENLTFTVSVNPKTKKVETHKQSYNDIKSTLSTLNQQESAEKDPDKIQEIRNKIQK